MVYGYLYRLHPETVDEKNTFRPNEGEANQLLKYIWRNDSLIMVMPKDEMIGMCRANGNWTSYAEATYKAVKLDNNTAAPSDAATVQDGLMLYMDVEGQSQLYPVKYAFDGDDELVTFSPDDYQNLETEMTDVPYSFSDQYEFYKYDENHRTIYFYKDVKKKIGMEAVYVDGDLRFGSGITEYYPNGDPTGVDMTEATVKQIKSVDFYDLSGRKLSALQRASASAPSPTPTARRHRERL